MLHISYNYDSILLKNDIFAVSTIDIASFILFL